MAGNDGAQLKDLTSEAAVKAVVAPIPMKEKQDPFDGNSIYGDDDVGEAKEVDIKRKQVRASVVC
jgi:hypothetical protein